MFRTLRLHSVQPQEEQGQRRARARCQRGLPPPLPPATGGTSSTFGRFCTAGLFVFLAIAALALLIYLFRRWRFARGEGSTGGDEAPFDALETHTTPAAAAEQEKARWSGSEPSAKDDWRLVSEPFDTATLTRREGAAGIDSRPVLEEDQLDAPLRPVGPPPSAAGWSEPAEPRQSAPVTPMPPASQTVSGLQKLVENMAVYQMGEPDYDEAFDINDPVDGYMGQCGLQLAEPFGRERDQAVALQVWLWDSRDPDTQALVLMSEGAYRDTSLRSEHEGEHGALSVKPGIEFELQSHDLLLRGRVEKVSYAEAEPPRGVFADLHVKLTVYRRS